MSDPSSHQMRGRIETGADAVKHAFSWRQPRHALRDLTGSGLAPGRAATQRSGGLVVARDTVNERRPVLTETDVLSEQVARNFLARASELDAALKGGTSIATLRAAAAEAGISSTAFDAALAEARAETPAPSDGVAARRSRRRSWLAGAALLVVGIASIGVQRSTVPVGTVEGSVQIRCLSQEDALEVIRPYVDRSSSVLAPPGSRFLRLRATPAQIDRIRSAIAQAEGAATSCSAR